MKSKDNIISLQIKNLIYVCEDEPKENLIIIYEDTKGKSQSIGIPLEVIETWWEE